MRLWALTIVMVEPKTCCTIRYRLGFASGHELKSFLQVFFRFPDKRDVRAHLEDSNAPQCQFHGAQSVQFLIHVVLNQCEKKSLKKFGLLTFSLKWNLFYGEQRRWRLHGHTNKSPPKIYKPIEPQTHITW